MKPYPYQAEGAQYLADRPRAAIQYWPLTKD